MLTRSFRVVVAVGLAVVWAVSIFITGSRSGLALLLVAVVLSGAVALQAKSTPTSKRVHLLIVVGSALFLSLLTATVIWLGRAVSIDRLAALRIADDQRVLNMPTVLDIIRSTFPIGTGFGSFDPVFRGYEDNLLLRTTYFNNAHNDLLEWIMTGNILSTALLVVFIFWFVRAAYLTFFRRKRSGVDSTLQQASAASIFIILASSLTDYPLRTPLISFVFAVCCVVLEYGVKVSFPSLPRQAG